MERQSPRPLTWLGLLYACAFAVITLFMPFQFQAEPYRLVYEPLRIFGVAYLLSAFCLGASLAEIGFPKWIGRLGKLLLVGGLSGMILLIVVPAGVWSPVATLVPFMLALLIGAVRPELQTKLLHLVLLTQPPLLGAVLVAFSLQRPGTLGAAGFALLVLSALFLAALALGRWRNEVAAVYLMLGAVPISFLAFAWWLAGILTGVLLHGILVGAMVTWALYLLRPWRLAVPRLRRRILFLAVALATVPIIILGSVFILVVQSGEKADLFRQLSAIAGELDRELDRSGKVDPAMVAPYLEELGYDSGLVIETIPMDSVPATWPGEPRGALEELPANGQRRVLAFIRRPDLGFAVVVHWPARQAYAQAYHVSQLILVGVLALGGSAAGLGMLLVNRLTRQIAEVRDVAVAIGERNFGARVGFSPSTDDDELFDLGRSIDHMVSTLEAYTEEIQAQNEELQAQSEELLAQQEELARQNEELQAHREELLAQNELLVERDRALRELAEAERATSRRFAETVALLDTFLRGSSVACGILTPDLRFLRVNEALAAMDGWPEEEHVGRSLQELLPQVYERAESSLRQVLQTGEPIHNWEASWAAQGKPGVTLHWLGHFYPVRLPDGEFLGVGVMLTDITGQKEMEQALRSSRALLTEHRTLLEQIATGVPLPVIMGHLAELAEQWAPDRSCAVHLLDESIGSLRTVASHTAPPEYCRLVERLSLESEQVSKLALSQWEPLVVENLPGDPEWAWARAVASGQVPVSAWSMPITSADGQVLGMISLFGEVPGRPNEMEADLLKSAARIAGIAIERQRVEGERVQKLHSLIHNMAEGVIAVNEDQTVLLVNPAAAKLLQIEGTLTQVALESTGLPPELVQMLQTASDPEASQPERSTFSHGPLEIEATVSPVLTEFHRHGAIAVLQDVTAEVQFRRLQENFVANVSHELRGPLASLSATLEAMADGVIPEDRRARYFQAMLDEMGRLRRLSYDVVDLTRMDSGLVEIIPTVVSLETLFASIRERFSQRFATAGITLEVRVLEVLVLADYDRADQIMVNLLENAIRYTPAGGTVIVAAEPEGDHVRVSVEDSGVGIPSEDLPYVWERFYKVDKARTRAPGSGTGLGLAIVKQLVRQMNGDVSVVSVEGEGSRFSFTLPTANRNLSADEPLDP